MLRATPLSLSALQYYAHPQRCQLFFQSFFRNLKKSKAARSKLPLFFIFRRQWRIFLPVVLSLRGAPTGVPRKCPELQGFSASLARARLRQGCRFLPPSHARQGCRFLPPSHARRGSLFSTHPARRGSFFRLTQRAEVPFFSPSQTRAGSLFFSPSPTRRTCPFLGSRQRRA